MHIMGFFTSRLGMCDFITITPLELPACLVDKQTFTDAEAEKFEHE